VLEPIGASPAGPPGGDTHCEGVSFGQNHVGNVPLPSSSFARRSRPGSVELT
jgi:hypothetical protein